MVQCSDSSAEGFGVFFSALRIYFLRLLNIPVLPQSEEINLLWTHDKRYDNTELRSHMVMILIEKLNTVTHHLQIIYYHYS